MPTYRIKYEDGTRDIQAVPNKMQLRFALAPGGEGKRLKVRRVKRIA